MAKIRDKFITVLKARAEDMSEEQIRAELAEEGYLSGTAIRNPDGLVQGGAYTGITAKGRLLLLELQKTKREESWLTKATELVKWLAIFFAGMFADSIKAWVTHLLAK